VEIAVRDAAERLGVSEPRVRQLLASGDPCKVGFRHPKRFPVGRRGPRPGGRVPAVCAAVGTD
jgi:hypothetical protein